MKKQKQNKIRLRYNLISMFVYIIGIVLLVQLFNLQIVKGDEYRKQSNTRLARESILKAARGKILDRKGDVLVSSSMGFSLNLYKTKVNNQVLNDAILEIINILEKNGDTYIDNLPIKVNPLEFSINTEKEIEKWKTENKIDKQYTVEQCFEYLKEKYEIINNDINKARKIMAIRYEITKTGYSSTNPLIVSKNISRTSALQISEQTVKFPGFDISTDPIVNYNLGSLCSHVLGTVRNVTKTDLEENNESYTQNDIIGKSGVQYVFESYLRGVNGIRQVDMDVDGGITGEYIAKEAVAGSDLVLTIDANLQAVTEDALKRNIEKIATGGFGQKNEAKAGAVVVMNVNTGEVLALASFPDYEPQLFVEGLSNDKYNEYSESSALYNRAISGSYAPGSTFKMITAIAGLETGGINIDTKINDTGVYPHAHKPVCWHWTSRRTGHGYLNVSDAIKHSCNYFFYEIGYRIGIDNLSKYGTYFGLGHKTGIELQSESDGKIASSERAKEEDRTWYLGETLSAAIGQSYNDFTPIQMAKYISILANGGNVIDVSIIKTIINSDGTEVSKQEIKQFAKDKLGLKDIELEQLDIKEENLNAVLEGMKGVTSESGGTAYSYFRSFDIEVAGKTGSAQAGNKTNAWFVGFAPYNKPEIAVVVIVENGGQGGYTAEVAIEVFSEYFGINTDKVVEDVTAVSTQQQIL